MNDNRPEFPDCEQYQPEVAENEPSGTDVLQVTDPLIYVSDLRCPPMTSDDLDTWQVSCGVIENAEVQ